MSSTTTPPGLGPATTMRKERESWGSFLAGSRGFLTHAAQSVSGPALSILSSTPSFKLIAPLAPGPSRGWRGPALEWNRGPRVESRPVPRLSPALLGTLRPREGAVGARPLWPAAGREAASMVVRCPAFQQSVAAAPAGRPRAQGRGGRAAALPTRAEEARGRPGTAEPEGLAQAPGEARRSAGR